MGTSHLYTAPLQPATQADTLVEALRHVERQLRPYPVMDDLREFVKLALATQHAKRAESDVVDYSLLVPHTWLDSLLTGPDNVLGAYPYQAADIERLLGAIRERIVSAMSAGEPR